MELNAITDWEPTAELQWNANLELEQKWVRVTRHVAEEGTPTWLQYNEEWRLVPHES